MSLGTILLIVLVLILLGVLPTWPHSRGWGYVPSGIVGTIVVILIILFLLGRWQDCARPRNRCLRSALPIIVREERRVMSTAGSAQNWPARRCPKGSRPPATTHAGVGTRASRSEVVRGSGGTVAREGADHRDHGKEERLQVDERHASAELPPAHQLRSFHSSMPSIMMPFAALGWISHRAWVADPTGGRSITGNDLSSSARPVAATSSVTSAR